MASLDERARPLYDARASDKRIAEQLGCARNTVRNWRVRNNLPPHYIRGQHENEHRAYPARSAWRDQVRALYDAGANDREIAEALGVHWTSVGDHRRRLGLPAQGVPGRTRASIERRLGKSKTGEPSEERSRVMPHSQNPAWRDPLWSRAAKAVGAKISHDMMEDAISDVVLAVLEGRLAESEIEKSARKFSNKTLETWGSRFGLASLDKERGEEGWCYYDLIPDEDQVAKLRVLELVALAEKKGIDVEALLNSDDDPDDMERWQGRGTIKRTGNYARPGDGRLAENRRHGCRGPHYFHLMQRARSVRAEAQRGWMSEHHRAMYEREATALEAQAEAQPWGDYHGTWPNRVWKPFVVHEYPLVGESRLPSYATGQMRHADQSTLTRAV